MAAQGSILGNAVLRKEDPALLTGAGKYYDDLSYTGMGHIAFVRSPFAHATLGSVDTSEAESMPGVIAVYTADNLDLPSVQSFPLLPETFNRPPLAKGKVRLVGDIVAMVVAETTAQAVDAADSIFPDYEPLPVVVDPEAALAEGAPLLFEEHGSNVAFETAIGGEENPLDGADEVAHVRMVSQRLAGIPMEPNGAVVVPGEPDGGLTVWVPSQAPIGLREPIAGFLGLEPSKVRIAAPVVGGGFGPKAALYVEFILAAAAAKALGRPVKWTETRSENLLSMVQGRGMVLDAQLGLRSDGTIVGMRADVIAEAGAYPAIGAILPLMTQTMAQGVYQIPKIHFTARSVMTNTTTTGAYRGAGRPEATQMLERVIDVAADQLGIDPAELRRKNLIPADAFPLTTVTGANYDSGEYTKSLDAALEASGYDALRAEQQKRRDVGDSKLMGIGVSAYVEITAPLGLHMEYGSVTVEDDGSVTARVGTSAHGQGHETAFAMIVSEKLGVPMDKVRLLQSDTDEIPRGSGTLGSRSLQTAGSAVNNASEDVLSIAKKLAAHLLEASPDDIVTGDGGLHVAGVPANALSWAELAGASKDPGRRPSDMGDGGLFSEVDFDGQDSTFPFGAHVAVVEVDSETGRVELVRHVAVDDCGRILNPMLVTGQQHGGIAQGAAQALYEIVAYDEDGNPVTGNLMDYAMPSAAELPSFETSNTQTDSPRNPLGAKGIGESGTIGSTPAIQNAVVDALSHLGVTHVDMPLTAERVWRAIEAARSSD
ncbi:MAG: xanthine dehydrogenase family protein molybdopterin-binding subunit [Actinomycetota bacterium]|nr:xanthine dehydrogenase family protein molybdopterin-binding subunit [Actinomycetota bacterium]